MPDWKSYVRERLDLSMLEDDRQERIIEELAGEVEDLWRDALAGGASEEAAHARVREAVPDWTGLARALTASARKHRKVVSERLLEQTEMRLSGGGGRFRVLAHIARDTRYTLRGLRRAPAFWVTSVLLLALGIGATTTIFSFVDAVLLKNLPYPDSTRLVELRDPAFPVPAFNGWKARMTSLELLAGCWENEADYTGGERPERLRIGLVTPGFFDLFGASPAHGRLFVRDDFAGAPSRALLSWAAWQRLFGGDATAVGQSLTIDSRLVEVVGVLDPGFVSPFGLAGSDLDVWAALDPKWEEVSSPGLFVLEVFGRLKGGVSLAAAQEELEVVTATLTDSFPEPASPGAVRSITLVPLRAALVGRTSRVLALASGAASLLLLIACANVASIFLSRGTARAQELAIRSVLGARRGRLAMQLVTESTLIAVMGGALGVALAWAGILAFEAWSPVHLPLDGRIALDGRTLAFAVATSLLTGVLFGLWPAWRAAGAARGPVLRDQVRGSVAPAGSRLRSALVVVEIGLSLVLLCAAGTLLRGFVLLHSVAPGFESRGLAAVTFRLGPQRYDDAARRDLVGRLLRRVRALPGVEAASASWTAPFQRVGGIRVGWMRKRFRIDGEDREVRTLVQPVTSEYLSLLRADLEGSAWSEGEGERQQIPTVVSDSFAKALLGRTDVIGTTFDGLEIGSETNGFRVVGVVSGLHHWGLDQGNDPTIYVPWERLGTFMPMVTLLVRSAGEPAALLPGLRNAVWAEDRDLPVDETFTIDSRIAGSLAAPRFHVALYAVFATVGLVLAAGGVYGSMLYLVGIRRRELAVRVALGAEPRTLLGVVLRHGGVVTLAGVTLGVGGAILAMRALEGFAYGTGGVDLGILVVVSAVIGVAAVAASLGPALQAAALDPMETLRTG